MFDSNSAHLSDEQLADSANSPHLSSCAECRRRVAEFQAAAAAYREYRDTIRAPLLPPTPDPWPSLSLLVARHEATTPPKRTYRWPVVLIAAACAAMAGTLAYKLVDRTAAPRSSSTMPHAEPPQPAPVVVARPQPTAPKSEEETPVSPKDMLRVFQALHEIGADVGEPLNISEDPEHRHVVVRASGLSLKQRQEIADALQPLAKVTLLWDAGSPSRSSPQPASSEPAAANIPDRMRRLLEDRLGGPLARQETTDRVLENSAAALARAYAVQVLAEKFPPEVAAQLSGGDHEVLRTLVRNHLSELDRLVSKVRAELEVLLPKSTNVPSGDSVKETATWQSAAVALVSTARENDTLLNRLLAGSYSQTEGDAMLASLGAHLRNFEAAVNAERREEK